MSGSPSKKGEDDSMPDENDFVDPDAIFTDPTGELPSALVKALHDPFDYALGLRDGRVIHFSEAHLQEGGKWVQLIGSGGLEREGGDGGSIEMSGVDYGFPRGLDVRLSDIMWVADAPNGS